MLSNILDYLELGKITRTPDQIAIIDQHRSFTFAQIELHSKSFGTLLMRRTDARREPIAVFLFKSADLVFADLGIAFTGNIYTNLDVKSPPQRIRNILDNLRPVIIITSMDLAPRLVALGVAEAALFFVEQVMGEEPQPDTAALEQRLSTIIDTGKHSVGEGSTFHKLHLRGKGVRFLFLGTTVSECFTYTHYVEERLDVPYRYRRSFHGRITDGSSSWEDTFELFVRYKGVVPSPVGKLETALLQRGLLHKEVCGDSSISWVDEQAGYATIYEHLTRDTLAYIQEDPGDRDQTFEVDRMVAL